MIRKFFLSCVAIVLVLTLVPSESAAQKSKYKPQQFIDKVLRSDPNMRDAIYAIKAVDQNGKVIAQINPNLPLLTASNLKTISTGIGLVCLGEDFKFKTKIAYSGTVKGNTLHGDLYIIGGGDPTLGSSDPVAYSIDSIFGVWADAVKALGVTKIEGNIVVDDSYFEREAIPSAWSWGNLGYDYGCAPSGLMFNENLLNVKLVPGKQEGDKVKIILDYPELPGFTFVNELSTGAAKTGNWSEFNVADLSMVGKFSGTVPMDRDTVKTQVSNKFPHISCGAAFRDFLIAKGVKVPMEIVPVENRCKNTSLTPVVETYSPELWKIVNVCNHISNNLYAEVIFRAVAKEMTGKGTYYAAQKYFDEKIQELGVSTVGYTQDDGSGLSRENYVSPEFFCNFFTMMSKQPVFQKYFESMPYPGVGTMRSVLKDRDPKYASNVHAKSGSLSCVKTYSGYVVGGKKSGLIKFSFLVNNYSCKTKEIQKRLEEFMYSLACTD